MKQLWQIGIVVCMGVSHPAFGRLTPEQLKQLPPAASRAVDFGRDIKPIFEASCIKCHGRGRSKGDFRLDTRETLLKGGESGPAAVIGSSGESLLIELVSGLDPDNVMPRKGSRLTREQIALLRAWIDRGAVWDAAVSFGRMPPRNLVPRRPDLPPARKGFSNPIDLFLARYFETNQIKWPQPVDDRLFARRAWLDVIGLVPGAGELESFLADRSSDKRARLVQRLLAENQRYAEHWLTFWNDALRNDYRGTGYIDGGRKQITAWLFSALATNMPYDRFVAQLINPVPECEGFASGIVWRGTVNASQTPQMQAAQNISQVFMGVNLKCASCHDSLINDWTLADAYGLANIYSDETLELYQCDKPTGKKAGLAFIYPQLGEIPGTTNKAARLQRLAEIITGRSDGRLSRTIVNRLWAKFFGRGLVEPVDDMEQAAWNSDLLDWLAEDLVDHHYDLKHTIARILTSRAYQLPAADAGEQVQREFVFRGPLIRRMSAEQFRDALGSLTQVWYAHPAGEFDFSCLTTNSGSAADLKGRWIWNDPRAAEKAPPGTVYFRKRVMLPAVPETAGAVISCDNSFTLSVNGKKVAEGRDFAKPSWIDLKPHLQKGENILGVEAVNHLNNNSPPAAGSPAPESEANPAGLYFSAWLRSSGAALDFGSDTSWVWSREKTDHWNEPGFAATDWQPAVELGGINIAPWNIQAAVEHRLRQSAAALPEGRVRSALANADPLTTALGRPNREQVITSRVPAATTLQALELTNGETLSQLLKQAAAKLAAAEPAAAGRLVVRLYEQAVGRQPNAEELKLSEALVGSPVRKEGVEDLLWAMSMLPEFQLIY